MKLNVNIPYGFKNEKPQLSTLNLLTFGIKSKYERGLNDSTLRIWGRIQNKIEAAAEKDENEVDLEIAEMDLCKKCVKEGTFPAEFAKYILLLEDEIDKAK